MGKGEQGVLLAEPYKSEIGPFWRFKTAEIATRSAEKIYAMFLEYKAVDDFVGMDMSRKYLQMGVTRARRYANHASGVKYAKDGSILPLEENLWESEKAKSALIFHNYYELVEYDLEYRSQKLAWKAEFG